MKHVLAWIALVSVLNTVSGCAHTRHESPPSQPEAASGFRAALNATVARHSMAAAANPLAAAAGQQILAAGGSAVDAAIAMQMVLSLVEPQSSGLGGGAFLLVWDQGQVRSYDGRETAPLAVDENLFLDAQGRALSFKDAAVGGRSVGTPGVLRVLELAHQQHGRLPWARLFQPAIALAEQGFPLSRRLHTLLAGEQHLALNDPARTYFYLPNGQPKAVGTTLKNLELAATLRSVAQQGVDAFYQGAIATDIVRAVQSHPTNPGQLSLVDLSSYQAKERAPLCTDYKDWRICGMGPPSSGGLAIAQLLGFLQLRNIGAVPPVRTADGRLEPQADAVHLLSEAERLVFADRAQFVADTDFVPLDINALLSRNYLAQRVKLIGAASMGRAQPGAPQLNTSRWAPDQSPHRLATSHISAVDAQGQAVAMTTSIEDAFGARLMVRGFLLNNQLTDFSFLPRAPNNDGGYEVNGALVANRVQPGKRPRSSMAPTLVLDRRSGALVATLGSPGGSLIINYVAKTLVGLLDWNLDIQQAISLPNFGSRNGPTEVEEGQVSDSLITQLKARGHEVRAIPMTSGLQGIVVERAASNDSQLKLIGGADPRREGVAMGNN